MPQATLTRLADGADQPLHRRVAQDARLAGDANAAGRRARAVRANPPRRALLRRFVVASTNTKPAVRHTGSPRLR